MDQPNKICTTAGAWFVLAFLSATIAAQPSQKLLPDTTKGYLSVPDVYQLEENWNKTQLGQLLQDPVMNGFGEDLKRQIKNKFSRLNNQLGLTLDDLEGVPGGELAVARILPAEGESAVAVLVDVTDHQEQANALLKKIAANMEKRKATKEVHQLEGTDVTIYSLPKRPGAKKAGKAVFFINHNVLCASDHQKVAMAILRRFSGEHKDTLDQVEAYQQIMDRCEQAAGDLQPEARWFVEPFGYVKAVRAEQAARGEKKKHGKDLLNILENEGFNAIQGLGGFVNFLVDDKYEQFHRTLVYAPAIKSPEKSGDKYNRAMRMLRFPNGGTLEPQLWVPRGLATYMSLNVDIQNAFDNFGTLFDAIVGEKDAWKVDVIEGIETDPDGPQINIRDEFIAYLGQRVTIMSDYKLPIDVKCERMLFAVETNNPEELAKTVERNMETESTAKKTTFEGHVVWEIAEEEEMDMSDEFDLQIPGVGPVAPPAKKKKKAPNSAVCVAHGQLLIATHIDFLKKALKEADERETLANSTDYRLIAAELEKVSGDVRSLRFFSRTDEEYRPTYELLRAGKMPEAETLLAKMLNRLLTEDEEEDIIREQLLDASKLPNFEMVRRYFGPAGMSIRSEEDGWFVTGFTLNKETP